MNDSAPIATATAAASEVDGRQWHAEPLHQRSDPECGQPVAHLVEGDQQTGDGRADGRQLA